MIENATIREIEQELRRLKADAAAPGETTTLRTRVLTQIVWIPSEWEPAASTVMVGLGERQPSRTIRLFPDPESERDALDAVVDLQCFAHGANRSVYSEVIAVWLRGSRTAAPASVVQPLLAPDLPAFLRWRGPLPFGEPELDQLVDVADRLVVDSRDWDDPETGFQRLPGLFDAVAVSDLAWARLQGWREAIAARWPGIGGGARLRVRGPAAEGILLARWLESRLGHAVRLELEPAAELELVEVEGDPAVPDRAGPVSASDLLSGQLEIFWRDPVYEAAVSALAPTLS